MKYTYLFLVLTAVLIFSQKSISQHKGEEDVYDLVPPKTLEIDNTMGSDNTKIGYQINVPGHPRLGTKGTATVKDISLPDITFRYGIIKNLELDINTGYRAITLTGNDGIKIPLKNKAKKLFNIDRNIGGLSSLAIGLKAGIFNEKDLRPSFSVAGMVSLPNTGLPEFQTKSPGLDLTEEFYKTFSDETDAVLDLGQTWNGSDPNPIFSFDITPSVSLTDDLCLFGELNGFAAKNTSADTRYDFGLDYTFSENFEGQVFIGSSFTTKNFVFFGLGLNITIPFVK